MAFCSPGANDRKYCYSIESLQKIANIWNDLCPYKSDKINIKHSVSNDICRYKININSNDNISNIIDDINSKFRKYKQNDKIEHWAWIDILKEEAKIQKKQNIITELNKIERQDLRPSQPKEWVKNPVEWLSNFDIMKVMNQYQILPKNKYKFLGVFSIDFGLKKKDGGCLHSDFCNINIEEMLKNGNIKYMGFITNLSRSNEPGTHWTSSFFVFDPNLPSFGGYYYDSTTGNIPKDLKPVFDNIRKQSEKLFKKRFPIQINKIRHQKSNTECGMFSMAFQLLWLNYLNKNNQTTFETIVKESEYTDDKMKKLRFRYFRPSIKSIL
jgi:hypothetical protein